MSTNLLNPSDKRSYPKHWKMVSAKALFREMNEKSVDGSETLLSVSHKTGIRPRSSNVTMFMSESLVGYKKCAVGDVAANTMWTWQGAIGVSDYDGVVSPAYNVYRQKTHDYNARFLDLLLREKSLVDVYHSLSTGIRPSRLRLYPDQFLTIRLPIPPREEQDQIVRYLDWQVSKVNRLIAAKRQQVELLKEQKQVHIDEACFGTFAKDTVYSIEWERMIPSGWETIKLNGLFRFGKGLQITKANLKSEGVPVISYGQVHAKTNTGTSIKDDLIRYVDEEYLNTSPSALVNIGDFIFADTSEDFAGVGNCVYVDRDGPLFAGYHTVIIRPNDCRIGRFSAYLFKTSTWRYQLQKRVNGVKVFSITQRILKDAYVLLPPKEEQVRIVKELDEYCEKVDSVMEAVNQQIDTLTLFRTRLISDVVTGQIDVRGIEIPDFEYTPDIDSSDDDECADDEGISEEA